MNKAVIVYHSKTGRTRTYAEKIGKYLKTKDIEIVKTDIEDFSDEMLGDIEYVFFGCWTHGLFFILQHPDKEWQNFIEKLDGKKGIKTALFTTYKILTGSMFKRMNKILNNKFDSPTLLLKSKSADLSQKDKSLIDQFL